MTVLQFPAGGSAGHGDDDALVCVCGSWWFVMRPVVDEPEPTFMLAQDGRVVGYSAVAQCVDCGRQQQ
jgi:hypothetical protein